MTGWSFAQGATWKAVVTAGMTFSQCFLSTWWAAPRNYMPLRFLVQAHWSLMPTPLLPGPGGRLPLTRCCRPEPASLSYRVKFSGISRPYLWNSLTLVANFLASSASPS